MLVLGFCMLTAAWPKAVTGWLDPHVYAVKDQMIWYNLLDGRILFLADGLLSIHSTFFWKMADWSTLALESAFILCVFSLRAMRVVVALAIFFHAAVYFSMGIFFSMNLPAYACLLNLRLFLRNASVRHAVSRFHRLARTITFLPLVVLAGFLTGFSYLFREQEINLAVWPDTLLILAALLVAGAYLVRFFIPKRTVHQPCSRAGI
jgi:hypothetical protein